MISNRIIYYFSFQPPTARMLWRMNELYETNFWQEKAWFIFTCVIGSSKAIKRATHRLIGKYITSRMEVLYGNSNLLLESGWDDNSSNTCNLITLHNHKQFDKYNIRLTRFLIGI